MTMLKRRCFTAVVVIGGITFPAAAETLEGSPVPQPIHGKPAYGYDDNRLSVVIGQLLGDRFSDADRTAVKQCASAAMQQAAVQYPPQPSGSAHPYGQGYNPAALMRIIAITDVQRGQDTLRISGQIDARFGHATYGQTDGYQNNGYTSAGILSFRCNVGYSGIVSNLRIHSTSSQPAEKLVLRNNI